MVKSQELVCCQPYPARMSRVRMCTASAVEWPVVVDGEELPGGDGA